MAESSRRLQDGYRTGFGTLAKGGLNWDSLPLKLFTSGNAKFWNPADLDFSQERAHWELLSPDEQFLTLNLCAQFVAGEEAVAEDIQPFMSAMAAEGRLGDELYLTQFAFEEAKHTQAFRLWLDAIGVTEDLHPFVEDNPGYRKIFYVELPKRLQALRDDPSPEAQVRASVTYNHVVEGMLALTGYHAWNLICTARDIFPGMRDLVRHIGDDERRHMAWGTFTCRRHVAADDALWEVVTEQMQSVMAMALEQVQHPYDAYADRIARVDFAPSLDEMASYALDRGSRRLGTIESARGRPLAEIDVDYEPAALEDRFAAEDAKLISVA